MELIPVTPTAKGPAGRFTGDVYVTQISVSVSFVCPLTCPGNAFAAAGHSLL